MSRQISPVIVALTLCVFAQLGFRSGCASVWTKGDEELAANQPRRAENMAAFVRRRPPIPTNLKA